MSRTGRAVNDCDPASSSPGQIGDLVPLLRRVVGARVSDAATVEDVVQETLARVLAVEDRLDQTSLGPYAVVTARNLVRSLARTEERHQRLSPGVVDPRQPEDPAERVTEDEDRRALEAALAQLPPGDRDSLIAHHLEGVDTATLGEQHGGSARAVSVRLVRARARLRVEYLLALRRVQLPTPACKPVLMAMSSGDRRRQRGLDAGEHLVSCPACSALSQPLVQRRRPLAAMVPALGLGRLVHWIRRQARAHPVRTGGVAATTVSAVVVVALVMANQPSTPALVVQKDPPVALSGDKSLAPYDGQPAQAREVRVQSVPDDEGFWVGDSVSTRVWVDLDSGGPLSGRVTAGQRVSFAGKVVPNPAPLLDHLGADAPRDREQLERQGYHVDIAEETLQSPGRPQPRRP